MKYDEDLYQWTIEQARALRDRATNALDYDNLAEEIESLGRSDKRDIESRLENLIIHLLKWRYQPEWRSPSWEASIDEARRLWAAVGRDNIFIKVPATSAGIPAIRRLPGCLGYYAATDGASSTMVNVSVWDTAEHAQAMATLAEMGALAQEFVALGAEFERPIVNYKTLWELS